MKHLIAGSALAALVATTAIPQQVFALDLGKTVRDTTRGVKDSVDRVTGNKSSSNGNSSGSSGGTGSSGSGGAASASASVGKKGVKVKVGSSLLGGTSVEAGALKSDAAATANASVGNTRVGAAVLSRSQLAAIRVDTNPPGTGKVTVPKPGGGSTVVGVTPAYARKLMASLTSGEEQIMLRRCAMILRSPKAFDSELVLLCRLVQQM